MLDTTLTLAQAESAPAGGAELVQVVIATGGALILTVALLVIGLGHRSGRIGLLRWADELSRRVGGNLPGWATGYMRSRGRAASRFATRS